MFYRIRYLLIIVFLFTGTVCIAQEATEDGENTESEEVASDDYITFSIGYDTFLKGLLASDSHWVPLPSDWDLPEQEIQANLVYRASEEIRAQGASLTISVGGVPIKTVEIIGDAQPHAIPIVFPSSLVYSGGIEITYDAYLRTTDEACEFGSLPSQWLIVEGDSTISLIPDDAPSSPTLDQIYASLASPNQPTQDNQLIIVLPDDLTASYLTAATEFFQWLGARSAYPGDVLVRYESMLTDEDLHDSNLVIISDIANSQLIQELIPYIGYDSSLDNRFLALDGEVIPDEDGILHILQSPWNVQNNILLITGNGLEGIIRASESLNDPELIRMFRGQSNFIYSATINEQQNLEIVQETDDIITFRDANITAVELSGIGSTVRSIFIPKSPGWILQDGAELNLQVNSTALGSGSTLSVFVEGVLVGIIDTSIQNQTNVTFPIPFEEINHFWQAHPSSTIEITFEASNFVDLPPCTTNVGDSVWTQVEDVSFLVLPHTYATLPNLDVFPYPFSDDEFSTTFVLPASPSIDEIEMLMQLVDQIVRENNLGIELYARTVDEFVGDDVENAIIIGQPERQPLIEDILQQVPGVEPLDVYTARNDQVGIVQQFSSPWDTNSYVLLLYGNENNAMNAAITMLVSNSSDVDDVFSVQRSLDTLIVQGPALE